MEEFVIGVDVDDVLASFTADALRRLSEHTEGRHHFTVQDVSTWDPFDSLPQEMLSYRMLIYDAMKAEGACFALPVEPGAREGIELLRSLGHVMAVTHPFKGAKTWTHERELWLEKHFGMHRDDIYNCKKKYRVHVDVFVDDKVANVEEWRAFHNSPAGVLWATPMNRSTRGALPLMTDWKKLADFVREVKQRGR